MVFPFTSFAYFESGLFHLMLAVRIQVLLPSVEFRIIISSTSITIIFFNTFLIIV